MPSITTGCCGDTKGKGYLIVLVILCGIELVTTECLHGGESTVGFDY